jgi:hypothetical protein
MPDLSNNTVLWDFGIYVDKFSCYWICPVLGCLLASGNNEHTKPVKYLCDDGPRVIHVKNIPLRRSTRDAGDPALTTKLLLNSSKKIKGRDILAPSFLEDPEK